MVDAYLDIETTGLSPDHNRITVVGIGLARGTSIQHIQLYDDSLNRDALEEALAEATRLYTYNGRRFDLPFLSVRLGVDLAQRLRHHDLMYDCWRSGLYGGLKAVEAQLGIPRAVTASTVTRRCSCGNGMKSLGIPKLWRRFLPTTGRTLAICWCSGASWRRLPRLACEGGAGLLCEARKIAQLGTSHLALRVDNDIIG